jgi:predicted AAA+ superfamily ATPase
MEALQYGTLPPLVDRPHQEKVEQLQAYVTTYLKEEIQAEALTRRLDAFHRFLEVAASCNGEIVNMTNVAQESCVPRKTVVSYYQILEDTLVGFFLPSWGHRLSRKELVTHGKFYFFDPGIVSALNQTLSLVLTEKNPLLGHRFEHFCILEFIRLHEYQRTEHRIGFFRTRAGAEVDLIQETAKGIRAIEFKAMRTISKGELRSLHGFLEEFPRAEAIVVCLAPHPLRLGKIQCLPWQEFLGQEFPVRNF